MTRLFTLLLCILSLNVAWAQDDLDEMEEGFLGEKTPTHIKIEYHSPFMTIKINDGKIYFSELHQEYDNPVSATPSSTVLEAKEAKMDMAEIVSIVEGIDEIGFINIEKDVYGAPENERHYTYKIIIEVDDKKKVVTYRSHPNYESEPDEFDEVEVFLRETVEGIEEWTESE